MLNDVIGEEEKKRSVQTLSFSQDSLLWKLFHSVHVVNGWFACVASVAA